MGLSKIEEVPRVAPVAAVDEAGRGARCLEFNSLQYLWFLPAVFALYYTLPHKLRNPMLLIASYYFYMCWVPQYAVLFFFSTFVTWLTGFMVSVVKDSRQRKIALVINIVINLGILGLFKYFNFFVDSLVAAGAAVGVVITPLHSSLLLPVGISFYTFQALGYSFDVYRGDIPHERNFFTYALFVSFFPQLVAGPIERAPNLLPQFYERRRFDGELARRGARLVLWGLFKKIAIADVIVIYINAVYGTRDNFVHYTGYTLIGATVAFAIYIYCDFSAYSDIAKGSAALLGFRLMDNFKTPYFATSISDFWARWHISLSTWFKDYLYIPLGGNRKGPWRKMLNLFIVFALSGLWHGADWTYVIWGLLHATYRVAEEMLHLVLPVRKVVGWAQKILYVFINTAKRIAVFALVCFGWIFFRANTAQEAFYIVRHLGENLDLQAALGEYSAIIASQAQEDPLFISIFTFWIPVCLIVLAVHDLVLYFFEKRKIDRSPLDVLPFFVRWPLYYALGAACVLFFVIAKGGIGEITQFIYFQF